MRRVFFPIFILLFLSNLIFSKVPLPSTWKGPIKKGEKVVLTYKKGLNLKKLYESPFFSSSDYRLLVIFEKNLYENLDQYVDLFFGELENSGYSISVYEYGSGTPEELRNFFKDMYFTGYSLKGVIFVGNLPYVIFEMYDRWEIWDYLNGYDDFPCDLFFMDMTGEWLDVGACDGCEANNGKYDKFLDDKNIAEIWVSRITPGFISDYDEYIRLLNSFFKKDYLYRHGVILNSDKALDYVDDDWKWMTNEDKLKLGILFGFQNVDVPVEDTHGNVCTAEDYKDNRMIYPYQMVYLRSHGSPMNHGFYQNDKSEFKYVLIDDYLNIMPSSAFYLLYTCSGCDFSYDGGDGFLGGRALFNGEGGLLSIGTTKTGGMWYDSSFFINLFCGKGFGESFLGWINDALAAYPETGKPWWYGMTIIGDGSLSVFSNGGICFNPKINVNQLLKLKYKLKGNLNISGCFDENGDGRVNGDDEKYLKKKMVNY